MKFKKLHYITSCLLAAIVALTMMSYSSGISGQSTAGCTCHAPAPSAATVISITGLPAQYVNGTTYNLTLNVTNAAKVAAGFDLTITSGTLAVTAANTSLTSTVELKHTAPKALVAGTTSWTFNWTAPATGSANVTFNVGANAVNLNTLNDVNDIWNLYNVIVPASPAPTVPTVTVGAPTGITSAAATINGTVNANNGSAVVTVEYGLTTAYGQTAAATPSPITGNTAQAVSSAISGLTYGTLYHYRIKAVNSAGTTNSPDNTFTTLAIAPTVTVGAVTAITNSTATINGTVNANTASTAITVEYGLTASYGQTATVTPSPVTGNVATAVTSALSALAAATTYHYRIVAVNSIGTTNSPDNTFTTLAAVTAPTIVVGAPTAITFNSATLNGTVNANGGSTAVSVEYGTTTSYGLTATVTPSPVTGITATAISSALSGLAASTTYHYRIIGTNSAGTTNSPDNTFTTAAAPAAPTVTVTTPTSITQVSAIVRGTVNANSANATVTVEYGLTTSYGSVANASPSVVTGSIVTNVSAGLTGLLPLTTYHYRFVAVNSIGTTNSADFTFTTLTNVTPPTIVIGTPSGITTTTGTINGTVNGNNGSTTITIEYGTTTAYGTSLSATPGTVTGNTPVAFTGPLSGLAPSTTYHYRIVAVNSTGSTTSPDNTFTTAGLPGLPVIILGIPNSITSNSANVTATVNATNDNTVVTVEYGLTTAYGGTLGTTPGTVTGSSNTSVFANITLLSPLTTYHYRFKAVNSVGTVTSADATFTTISQFVLPTIVLGTPSNISYNRGVVNATVNANNFNTAVTVEYGTTTTYGNTLNATPAQVFGTFATPISATLNQLLSNTTYHYRIAATNTAGTVYSADDVFTTTVNHLSVGGLEAAGFHLFPNPGKDQLMLTTKDNVTVTIEGTSMDGKTISLPNRKVASDQYQIDISHLPAGMYLMTLKRDGESFSTRFSKM